MDEEIQERPAVEYEKPQIRDYGELRELTASLTTVGTTDVPKGTPGPIVFSP
jgi:hypothetical protein